MVEFEDVKSCVKDLYAMTEGIITDTKGNEIPLKEFQELVAERVINLCDLLGISNDVYLK
ncbi:hypothetical protein [Vagococcus fluvialis]|uniref:hypothetical protein n=1 Tax=Vagococcus fluvialis TaxID=2738 RepID=UPI003B20CC0E